MSPNSAPDKPDSGGRLSFSPVSPLLIRPNTEGRFAVYLKQGGRFVLYTSMGESFTPDHRNKLFDLGIKEVFILTDERKAYDGYLEDNLGPLLLDEAIPLEERSGALYEASLSVVKDVFSEKLPRPLTKTGFERVRNLVEAGMAFFNKDASLKAMAKLISQDYDIYNHSVNVMVMQAFLLQPETNLTPEQLVQCGIGAILHDIGKSRLPKKLLDRRFEALSLEEREMIRTHPNLGVALAADVPITPEVMHAILFHHEHEDGSGYPAGIPGEAIPRHVKALSVCNLYDNLTTGTDHRPAKSPFEALQQIKQRQNEFSTDMIKRLILMLANAEIV